MFINIVIIDIDRVVLRNRYETRSERSCGVAFGAPREYYFVVDCVTVRLPKDIHELIGGLAVRRVMTVAFILFLRKNILSGIICIWKVILGSTYRSFLSERGLMFVGIGRYFFLGRMI
jgi:hypothetical protein